MSKFKTCHNCGHKISAALTDVQCPNKRKPLDPYTLDQHLVDDDYYWDTYMAESWMKALGAMYAGAKQVGISFENLKKKIDEAEAKTKSDWEERHSAWIEAVSRVPSPLVLFPKKHEDPITADLTMRNIHISMPRMYGKDLATKKWQEMLEGGL